MPAVWAAVQSFLIELPERTVKGCAARDLAWSLTTMSSRLMLFASAKSTSRCGSARLLEPHHAPTVRMLSARRPCFDVRFAVGVESLPRRRDHWGDHGPKALPFFDELRSVGLSSVDRSSYRARHSLWVVHEERQVGQSIGVLRSRRRSPPQRRPARGSLPDGRTLGSSRGSWTIQTFFSPFLLFCGPALSGRPLWRGFRRGSPVGVPCCGSCAWTRPASGLQRGPARRRGT